MQQSDEIKELAVALSKAQSEFGPAHKSGVNPHLKNKYATLDDIIDAVRNPLAAHGLSFLQMLDTDGQGPALTTMLLHESGQWLAGSTPIDAMDSNRGTNDMQAFGATLTYLKRYALAAMLGVSSDEDTDAEGAKTSKRTTGRKPSSDNGDGGDDTLGFGKYKGKTWAWVLANHRDYLEWLAENSDYQPTLDKVNALLAGEPQDEPKPEIPTDTPQDGGNGTGGDRDAPQATQGRVGPQEYWHTYHHDGPKAAGVAQKHASNIAKKYGDDGGDWDKAISRLMDAMAEAKEA